MSSRMPLNYSDATELDGNLDDAIEEVMREKAVPGRDVEGMKRISGLVEEQGGTSGDRL